MYIYLKVVGKTVLSFTTVNSDDIDLSENKAFNQSINFIFQFPNFPNSLILLKTFFKFHQFFAKIKIHGGHFSSMPCGPSISFHYGESLASPFSSL